VKEKLTEILILMETEKVIQMDSQMHLDFVKEIQKQMEIDWEKHLVILILTETVKG
jgi:hypothetical protein